MLNAIHRNVRPQHVVEHIEFSAAKSLTARGGGTDRTMVLQQQKPVGIDAPFGHVSFTRTDLRQACHAGAQRRGTGERGTVGASGFLLARAYKFFQCRLPERHADRVYEMHSQFGMRVGEATVRRSRQVPVVGGSTNALLFSNGFHQPVMLKSDEVLPRSLGCRAKYGRDVCGTERPAPLDQAEYPVAARTRVCPAVFQAHACILRRGDALCKHLLG